MPNLKRVSLWKCQTIMSKFISSYFKSKPESYPLSQEGFNWVSTVILSSIHNAHDVINERTLTANAKSVTNTTVQIANNYQKWRRNSESHDRYWATKILHKRCVNKLVSHPTGKSSIQHLRLDQVNMNTHWGVLLSFLWSIQRNCYVFYVFTLIIPVRVLKEGN